jgi:uncharacterized membrane protein
MKPPRESSSAPYSRMIDPRLVEEFCSHHLISAEARVFALELLNPTNRWVVWIGRLLSSVGLALVLSGVVYFFAYNWTRVPAWLKLGGLQATILAALAGCFFLGEERRSGKLALAGAAVLTGVFLAVFGQIYQTGADAHALFLYWAGLILPWTLMGRFAPLWAILLLVFDTGVVLWWTDRDSSVGQWLALHSFAALFHLFLLGVRELSVARGADWLAKRWTRVGLAVGALVATSVPGIVFLVDPGKALPEATFGFCVSVLVTISIFVVYRYVVVDMWCMAAAVLLGCVLLDVGIGRMLVEGDRDQRSVVLLVIGIVTLGIFAAAVAVLRMIAERLEVTHE